MWRPVVVVGATVLTLSGCAEPGPCAGVGAYPMLYEAETSFDGSWDAGRVRSGFDATGFTAAGDASGVQGAQGNVTLRAWAWRHRNGTIASADPWHAAMEFPSGGCIPLDQKERFVEDARYMFGPHWHGWLFGFENATGYGHAEPPTWRAVYAIP